VAIQCGLTHRSIENNARQIEILNLLGHTNS